MLLRASSAMAIALLLSGCAHAYEPYGYGPEILSALPADAPPGECYARVKVPGGPAHAPPTLQGAQWVLMPAPPGSPGPIWCLVPTGPQPVAWEAPARYGFVRVLCEDEMTGPRVTGIQRSLYERGYYRGGFTGRYDQTTAAAVAQFQTSAQIAHGGYLSFETVQALEGGVGYGGQHAAHYGAQYGAHYGAPYSTSPYGGGYAAPQYPAIPHGSSAYGASAAASAYAGGGYQSHSGYAVQGGYAGGGGFGYGGVSPCLTPCAPPLPPPPPPCFPCAPPPPPPCPTVQWCGGVSSGYGQGYSYGAAYHSPAGYYGAPRPAYAAASAHARAGGAYASARASSSVQSGWLTWGGKSGF